MRRGLDLDVLECPCCGARMALVATILSPAVARRILEHLALPSEPIGLHPARAPPDPDEDAGPDFDAAADASPTRARLERARQRMLR
jgi:hypothetical protein